MLTNWMIASIPRWRNDLIPVHPNQEIQVHNYIFIFATDATMRFDFQAVLMTKRFSQESLNNDRIKRNFKENLDNVKHLKDLLIRVPVYFRALLACW